MKAALVLTSINDVPCLGHYFDNFKRFGHLDDVKVFLIADTKTPKEALTRCLNLMQQGLNVHCVSIRDQERFLNQLHLPASMFPRNSDSRRNVGYLMALDTHVDFVMSIDDDNYCHADEDFFAEHSNCCKFGTTALSKKSGWLNPCDWLDMEHAAFQRGFPYKPSLRTFSRAIPIRERAVDIHANMGLWLRDPDFDALTWLATPTVSTKVHSPFIVAGDTWAPINSQNTAVRCEAMAAYFFIPMPTDPPLFDRYGDILQGYFLEACMKHLGGHLRIGTPVVDHIRNSHNYFNDARKELPCIMLLEQMLPWLTECRLSGADYCETYDCLASVLEDWVSRQDRGMATEQFDAYLYEVAAQMRCWIQACRTIGMVKASV
jgi:hypothetical protein